MGVGYPSRLFHSFWVESILIVNPWEKTPDHPQAELGLSHIWPEVGSNPQWWDDEWFRALKISNLNHLAALKTLYTKYECSSSICVRVTNCQKKKKVFEPQHDKTNKMTWAASEDWDQPGHQSSVCPQWVAKDPSFLHVDSQGSDQSDPSLCWAHRSFCWFWHEAAHLSLTSRVDTMVAVERPMNKETDNWAESWTPILRHAVADLTKYELCSSKGLWLLGRMPGWTFCSYMYVFCFVLFGQLENEHTAIVTCWSRCAKNQSISKFTRAWVSLEFFNSMCKNFKIWSMTRIKHKSNVLPPHTNTHKCLSKDMYSPLWSNFLGQQWQHPQTLTDWSFICNQTKQKIYHNDQRFLDRLCRLYCLPFCQHPLDT